MIVEIPIPPRGKGRHLVSIERAGQRGGPRCPYCRKHVALRMRPDPKSVEAEQAICHHLAEAAAGHALAPPLEVGVLAVYQRPQSLFRLADFDGLAVCHGTRSDVDNAGKLVLDGAQRCTRCLKPQRGAKRERCSCLGGARPLMADDRHVGRLVVEQARSEILNRRLRLARDPRLVVGIRSLPADAPLSFPWW